MKIRSALLFILLSVSISSCRWPECKNKNPIFDQVEPNSKIYKDELVNEIIIRGQESFGYWFDSYLEEDGKEYIWVKIQGRELCAKVLIQVLDWHNIEAIKRTKGKGYENAQLVGLTFGIKQDSLSTEFIYNYVIMTLD